jgi:undecaprenyl-diphosphatase
MVQDDVDTIVVESSVEGAVRSPADILRLAFAAAVLMVFLLVQWIFGDTLVEFSSQLFRGLDAIPSWIVDVAIVGSRLLAVVFIVGGLVVTLLEGRFRYLMRLLFAAAVAAGVAYLLDRVEPAPAGSVVDTTDALGGLSGNGFPTGPGLAAVAAIVTASAPWLSRRWRRLGWLLVFALAFDRFMTSPLGFDTVRGVLVGWAIGAAVVVLFGGPSRRPTGRAIADGLARVGFSLARLEQASLDARGSTPYFGQESGGRKLFVKALGDDQRSADILFRLYRYATRRELGDERPFSSLRRTVEHEAFVSLAARDIGVRTPRLVAVATADPNAFVLAYEAIDGRSLDRLTPEELTDDVLGAIWDQVRLLRRHRFAHRDLRLANVFLADDGNAWAIDFGFSEVAASDVLLATDVAELTTSLASMIGPERAVGFARRAVGSDGLQPAVDRLHMWALSGATRAACKERPALLDAVRGEMQKATA